MKDETKNNRLFGSLIFNVSRNDNYVLFNTLLSPFILWNMKLTDIMKGAPVDYFPEALTKLQEKALKKAFLVNEQLTDVMNTIVHYTGTSEEDIKGKNRDREIVYARHLFCYFSVRMTKAKLAKIADFIGDDYRHTSVLHAVRKIDNLAYFNKEIKSDLQNLKQTLTEKLKS